MTFHALKSQAKEGSKMGKPVGSATTRKALVARLGEEGYVFVKEWCLSAGVVMWYAYHK